MRLDSMKNSGLSNHIKTYHHMKNLTLLRVAAAWLLVLLLSSYLPAQTNISGTVSGVWNLAGSPYLIVGDANIPAGSSLQIEAGVSVQFTGEYLLEVFGNIQAIGTEQDSIEFKSTSSCTKGLHIINGQDTCRFIFCIFNNFTEQTNMGSAYDHYYKGGAMYAANTLLVIVNSIFQNNSIVVSLYNVDFTHAYGGALCLENCSGCISNSTFTNNFINVDNDFCFDAPVGEGGAIYCTGNMKIKSSLISQNIINVCNGGYDQDAGAIAHGGGISTTSIVENCVVSFNGCITVAGFSCEMSPGGAYGHSHGGGIYGGSLINNNTINNNNCQSEGSGGGMMYCTGSGSGQSYGGGICSGTIVQNNKVYANTCTSQGSGDGAGHAKSNGGGIYGCTQIDNNIVYSNSCSANASGGIVAYSESQGGGIMNGTMQNNTVLSNSISASGNGTITKEGSGVYGGTVKNSIVYSNNVNPQVSSSTVTYSCIQGGYSGTGNISSDPLFVTGPDGNYYLSQLAAGQSQQSPCVDAGDPTTPLFQGTTRTDLLPDLGIIDMGYHYQTPYKQVISLDIKVMLQGPFAGTGMQTNLNNFNYLPLAQPFQGAPWNYNGAEAVTAIPNNTIVDWILLELRQAPGASQALPGTMLCRQAAFVNNNGEITGLDGDASKPVILTIPQILNPGNGLFIIVWHRNHLGVLSSEPMQQSGPLFSYDFSTGADKAFGGVNGHIEVGQGIWGMVSGDGDANGQVNNVDKVEVWKPQGGFSGYRAGDFNLDGQVNNQDKIDQWAPNGGRSCQVSFTMTGSLPEVVTVSIIDITDMTATGEGNVTGEGSYPVTERGFCWGTQPYPSLYDPHTHNGSGSGFFTGEITGLIPITIYYVRAYASNLLGTSYGNQFTFTTLNPYPVVITTEITDITDSSATGGGNVIGEGWYPVTARGICWGTSPNPTLNDQHTVDGSGLGVFVSHITGLIPLTTYYVRAYATNQAGIGYGNQFTFTTLNPYPVVTTTEITNITDSSATGGGNVIDEGWYPVTARGICWGTSPNPTLNNQHTVDGSGLGVFVSQITGLTPLTIYFVRAYATNQAGTAYGSQVTFMTLSANWTCGDFIYYEEQIYSTVQIGMQCWMAENLNIGTMILSISNQTNNGIIEKYCYDDSPANCDVYGGLYQWKEMMQYVTTPGIKGICPDGWHLPTDEEWCTLEQYVDPTITCSSIGWRGVDGGGKLKEAGTVHWAPPNTGATNSSGFTALPGGYRQGGNNFNYLTLYGQFWSSTKVSGYGYAWCRFLGYDYASIKRCNSDQLLGFSVRCVKD
jgi:uncharacterized protein (TIGR02145 family)